MSLGKGDVLCWNQAGNPPLFPSGFISPRLRFFVQLEDELQSLQHSQRWLEEKGKQLAQRDSELAADALREVTLVKTAWDNVKMLITNG